MSVEREIEGCVLTALDKCKRRTGSGVRRNIFQWNIVFFECAMKEGPKWVIADSGPEKRYFI
jgi:hypothetical protein